MSTPLLTTIGSAALVVLIFNLFSEIYYQIKLYVLPRFFRGENLARKYGGKWAVITGGSDGIGKGYAIELAKRGMNICVMSNMENNIVNDIQYYGVECTWIDVDFSSLDVYDGIKEKLSPIIRDVGILINNVGILQRKMQAIADQNEEFFERIINVNMASTVFMTKIVLDEMIRRNKGLIVNMGSIASSIIFPFETIYSASKSFIETYSVGLARELKNTDVRVKCIQPSFVNTGLVGGFSSILKILNNYMSLTFPNGQQFAKSATATFSVDTPVCYNGYWTHSLIRFFIPYSFLGPQRVADFLYRTMALIGECAAKHIE